MNGVPILLIVDVQRDFCPGGTLAVAHGDEIIPTLNRYIRSFFSGGFPIIASRDWHPQKTTHFKRYGGNWPQHCIASTPGAQFHPMLDLPESVIIVSKGMDAESEGYSAFQAVTDHGEDLPSLMSRLHAAQVFVGGLATDYCVKRSILDSMEAGYRTFVLLDAIAGVNLRPDDSTEALREMRNMGAVGVTYTQVNTMLKGDELCD